MALTGVDPITRATEAAPKKRRICADFIFKICFQINADGCSISKPKTPGISLKRAIQSLYQDLDLLYAQLTSVAEEFLADRRHKLSELGSELHRLSPKARLGVTREKVNQLNKRLQSAGFESVLARGYSIVRDAEGKVISSSKSIKTGKKIRLKFSDGDVGAVGE